MGELKPCPFCGAKETDTNRAGWKQLYVERSKHDCYMVLCAKCGSSTSSKDTERAARMAWNRRADYGKRKAAD